MELFFKVRNILIIFFGILLIIFGNPNIDTSKDHETEIIAVPGIGLGF